MDQIIHVPPVFFILQNKKPFCCNKIIFIVFFIFQDLKAPLLAKTPLILMMQMKAFHPGPPLVASLLEPSKLHPLLKEAVQEKEAAFDQSKRESNLVHQSLMKVGKAHLENNQFLQLQILHLKRLSYHL